MNYFAYGSNMSSERMKTRVPSVSEGTLGFVSGHTLRFHKRGLRDGSGKCDGYYTGNSDDQLYGVLYQIDDIEKADLDEVEGLGLGYLFKEVSVFVPDRGVEDAWMYVADPEYVDESLEPFVWYIKLVLVGALEHNLPHDYILKFIASRLSDKKRLRS
jgi:gamma-glutamylcyclotransferase